MAITIPFKRVLRLASRGNDVRAIKRGLALSGVKGTGKLRDITRPAFYGPFTVLRMKRFQASVGLKADGVYGPKTHRFLQEHFDRYARLLYTKPDPVPPPPAHGLQLPKTFTPTHQTSGLPGYPAIDVFAKPGTPVLAPAAGTVKRLSGHDPANGPVGGVHGPYGWSMYVESSDGKRYMTHFGRMDVKVGEQLKAGQVIGTVGDYDRWGGWAHIHLGFDAK
jgi:murein DD-endopeptidase MepM/ murein hydrolase activator NlpD